MCLMRLSVITFWWQQPPSSSSSLSPSSSSCHANQTSCSPACKMTSAVCFCFFLETKQTFQCSRFQSGHPKLYQKIPKSSSQPIKLQLQCVRVDSVWYGGFGYSSVPVKEHLVDSASAVYRAVQSAEKDPELGDRGCHCTSMQSKSFQVLTHMTQTESSKFVVAEFKVWESKLLGEQFL